ncbi:hypothetical protein Tco_0849396 [Tanacetum coccineum]
MKNKDYKLIKTKDSRTQTTKQSQPQVQEARFNISPKDLKTHHLGILLAQKNVLNMESTESAGSLALREIVSLKILSQTRKLDYMEA